MPAIRPITTPNPALIAGLAQLLIDAVHGGASLGFLAPLAMETAQRYWEGVMHDLGPGFMLWIAEEEGDIVGTVQLELAQRENGRHRAEVMKLMVLSSHRGRGIASQLLAVLENVARSHGRTTLVLDTEAQSGAEAIYQHLKWQRAGEIPAYAANPNGVLRPTVYYYKLLA